MDVVVQKAAGRHVKARRSGVVAVTTGGAETRMTIAD